MTNNIGWLEEDVVAVYARCLPVVGSIHHKNFEIRFGYKPNAMDIDFPTFLNALDYCMVNKLLPVGDIWVIAQNIYNQVLTNELMTKGWAPEALPIALKEYERIKADMIESMKIK